MNGFFDTPWKYRNEIIRWLVFPYIRSLFFFNRIIWGNRWRFYGLPVLQKHRRSEMRFGDGLSLRSSVRSNPLGPNHPIILCTWQAGAVLEIGDNFGMTGGSICAAEHITIGNCVVVGANTIITDTDFHPINPQERSSNPQTAKTMPIIIENDVFIGMNCLILKGVHLGQGCAIGAGSVVTRDVPARMIVAGNPAIVIKSI